jgi:hypothetical protein
MWIKNCITQDLPEIGPNQLNNCQFLKDNSPYGVTMKIAWHDGVGQTVINVRRSTLPPSSENKWDLLTRAILKRPLRIYSFILPNIFALFQTYVSYRPFRHPSPRPNLCLRLATVSLYTCPVKLSNLPPSCRWWRFLSQKCCLPPITLHILVSQTSLPLPNVQLSISMS